MFPFMEDFLNHLKSKAYQKRTVAVIENGSWAPMSGKLMRELLSQMKNVTVLDNTVTIRSAVKPETKAALKALCEELTALN
jgi:flavorubredoxin